MNDKYYCMAQKLIKSFEGNLNAEGDDWKYAFEASKEWMRLLNINKPCDNEVQKLIRFVNSPPESQGCAYLELQMLINKWSKG